MSHRCRDLQCEACARRRNARSRARRAAGGFANFGFGFTRFSGAKPAVIAYGAGGALTAGNATVANPTPVCPSGVTAGQLLVCFIWGVASTAVAFSAPGWSAAPGGVNAPAQTRYALAYYKIADGSESGTTVTFTISGGATNKPAAQIHRFSTTGGNGWSLAGTSVADASFTTAHSIVAAAGVDIKVRDLALVFFSVDATGNTTSAESLTASGLTLAAAVERQDAANALSPWSVAITEHLATAGQTTSQATYAATTSSSSPLVGGLLRLRGL